LNYICRSLFVILSLFFLLFFWLVLSVPLLTAYDYLFYIFKMFMSKLPPFVYNFKELFLFVAWDWDTVNILFLAAPWRRSQRGTSTAISPGRLRNYGGRNGMGRFCTKIYLECKYTFGFRFMVFNVTFNNISVFYGGGNWSTRRFPLFTEIVHTPADKLVAR
jgi:hypothetical protein